jgi:16S rRNA (guanine527-N7)-methyltransferase
MKNDDLSKKYFELINSKYQGINLTSFKEYPTFHVKQVEDSLLPFNFEELQQQANGFNTIVDIGFGGGFPLLPLANKFQDKALVGIDARKKKANVVLDIAKDLSLKNVKTIHSRVEDIVFDDILFFTVKAVGKIEDVLNRIDTKEGSLVLFYKGRNYQELEKLDSQKILKFWDTFMEKEYELSNGDHRSILVYKRNNVPRRTTKKLVKLSELI